MTTHSNILAWAEESGYSLWGHKELAQLSDLPCPFNTVTGCVNHSGSERTAFTPERCGGTYEHGHRTSSHDTGGWTSVSESGSSTLLLTNQ